MKKVKTLLCTMMHLHGVKMFKPNRKVWLRHEIPTELTGDKLTVPQRLSVMASCRTTLHTRALSPPRPTEPSNYLVNSLLRAPTPRTVLGNQRQHDNYKLVLKRSIQSRTAWGWWEGQRVKLPSLSQLRLLCLIWSPEPTWRKKWWDLLIVDLSPSYMCPYTHDHKNKC